MITFILSIPIPMLQMSAISSDKVTEHQKLLNTASNARCVVDLVNIYINNCSILTTINSKKIQKYTEYLKQYKKESIRNLIDNPDIDSRSGSSMTEEAQYFIYGLNRNIAKSINKSTTSKSHKSLNSIDLLHHIANDNRTSNITEINNSIISFLNEKGTDFKITEATEKLNELTFTSGDITIKDLSVHKLSNKLQKITSTPIEDMDDELRIFKYYLLKRAMIYQGLTNTNPYYDNDDVNDEFITMNTDIHNLKKEGKLSELYNSFYQEFNYYTQPICTPIALRDIIDGHNLLTQSVIDYITHNSHISDNKSEILLNKVQFIKIEHLCDDININNQLNDLMDNIVISLYNFDNNQSANAYFIHKSQMQNFTSCMRYVICNGVCCIPNTRNCCVFRCFSYTCISNNALTRMFFKKPITFNIRSKSNIDNSAHFTKTINCCFSKYSYLKNISLIDLISSNQHYEMLTYNKYQNDKRSLNITISNTLGKHTTTVGYDDALPLTNRDEHQELMTTNNHQTKSKITADHLLEDFISDHHLIKKIDHMLIHQITKMLTIENKKLNANKSKANVPTTAPNVSTTAPNVSTTAPNVLEVDTVISSTPVSGGMHNPSLPSIIGINLLNPSVDTYISVQYDKYINIFNTIIHRTIHNQDTTDFIDINRDYLGNYYDELSKLYKSYKGVSQEIVGKDAYIKSIRTIAYNFALENKINSDLQWSLTMCYKLLLLLKKSTNVIDNNLNDIQHILTTFKIIIGNKDKKISITTKNKEQLLKIIAWNLKLEIHKYSNNINGLYCHESSDTSQITLYSFNDNISSHEKLTLSKPYKDNKYHLQYDICFNDNVKDNITILYPVDWKKRILNARGYKEKQNTIFKIRKSIIQATRLLDTIELFVKDSQHIHNWLRNDKNKNSPIYTLATQILDIHNKTDLNDVDLDEINSEFLTIIEKYKKPYDIICRHMRMFGVFPLISLSNRSISEITDSINEYSFNDRFNYILEFKEQHNKTQKAFKANNDSSTTGQTLESIQQARTAAIIQDNKQKIFNTAFSRLSIEEVMVFIMDLDLTSTESISSLLVKMRPQILLDGVLLSEPTDKSKQDKDTNVHTSSYYNHTVLYMNILINIFARMTMELIKMHPGIYSRHYHHNIVNPHQYEEHKYNKFVETRIKYNNIMRNYMSIFAKILDMNNRCDLDSVRSLLTIIKQKKPLSPLTQTIIETSVEEFNATRSHEKHITLQLDHINESITQHDLNSMFLEADSTFTISKEDSNYNTSGDNIIKIEPEKAVKMLKDKILQDINKSNIMNTFIKWLTCDITQDGYDNLIHTIQIAFYTVKHRNILSCQHNIGNVQHKIVNTVSTFSNYYKLIIILLWQTQMHKSYPHLKHQKLQHNDLQNIKQNIYIYDHSINSIINQLITKKHAVQAAMNEYNFQLALSYIIYSAHNVKHDSNMVRNLWTRIITEYNIPISMKDVSDSLRGIRNMTCIKSMKHSKLLLDDNQYNNTFDMKKCTETLNIDTKLIYDTGIGILESVFQNTTKS